MPSVLTFYLIVDCFKNCQIQNQSSDDKFLFHTSYYLSLWWTRVIFMRGSSPFYFVKNNSVSVIVSPYMISFENITMMVIQAQTFDLYMNWLGYIQWTYECQGGKIQLRYTLNHSILFSFWNMNVFSLILDTYVVTPGLGDLSPCFCWWRKESKSKYEMEVLTRVFHFDECCKDMFCIVENSAKEHLCETEINISVAGVNVHINQILLTSHTRSQIRPWFFFWSIFRIKSIQLKIHLFSSIIERSLWKVSTLTRIK